MRRVIVTSFTSLDGVMQAPSGPQKDPTGGFTLGEPSEAELERRRNLE